MNLPVHVSSALKNAAPSLALGNTAEYSLENLIGSSPELIEIPVADGAGDTRINVSRPIRVLDVWTLKTTATGVGSTKTATLKKTSGATTSTISSAISLASAVGTVARTTTLANTDLAAGDKLVVTIAETGEDSSCKVYVLAQRL